MTEQLPTFDTKEEAFDWMEESVSDLYMDNERFAYVEDPIAMAQYDKQQDDGCCGSFDAVIMVDGKEAMIGCNYGH